uniref:Uncharacterized protein n=1 Tax=Anguilla anguilla TaxID=7936 RepID=A0A0E9WXN4_ANGAN
MKKTLTIERALTVWGLFPSCGSTRMMLFSNARPIFILQNVTVAPSRTQNLRDWSRGLDYRSREQPENWTPQHFWTYMRSTDGTRVSYNHFKQDIYQVLCSAHFTSV